MANSGPVSTDHTRWGRECEEVSSDISEWMAAGPDWTVYFKQLWHFQKLHDLQTKCSQTYSSFTQWCYIYVRVCVCVSVRPVHQHGSVTEWWAWRDRSCWICHQATIPVMHDTLSHCTATHTHTCIQTHTKAIKPSTHMQCLSRWNKGHCTCQRALTSIASINSHFSIIAFRSPSVIFSAAWGRHEYLNVSYNKKMMLLDFY